MSRSKELSEKKLEKLTKLIKLGTFTNMSIARQLEIGESTVRYHKKRVLNEGRTYKMPRSGRRRLLSERGVEYLKLLSAENEFMAPIELSKELAKIGEPKVSRQTVKRRLKENGSQKFPDNSQKNSSHCVVELKSPDMRNPDGKESASGENGASTSDVDDPVPQRRLVDEVGNSVADTSNQIYIQERDTKDSSLHKLSNCTEYLTNDNIKSEFDNSVSTVRIENNIGDNSILLRSIPTPTGAHLDNSIDKISVKASNVENVIEDEFEAFGKYVAMALRKMPMSNALSVENQIFSTINKERRLILLQNDQSGINIGVGVKMEIEDEPI